MVQLFFEKKCFSPKIMVTYISENGHKHPSCPLEVKINIWKNWQNKETSKEI
jgi:hypothetical protein